MSTVRRPEPMQPVPRPLGGAGRRVLLVIVARRSAPAMHRALWRLRAGAPWAHILVVVDAACPEATAAHAASLAPELGRITVVRKRGMVGRRAASSAGLAWGVSHGFDVLIDLDVEHCHDTDVLAGLVAEIDDGADQAVDGPHMHAFRATTVGRAAGDLRL